MIEYNTKVWFRHILDFHRTDTFRILLWEMLIVALYTGIVAAIEIHFLRELREDGQPDAVMSTLRNTTIMHSILGFVLSLLVVFRTNTAYDRWWEGRKQWGMLVNNTRNLAIKINSLLPAGLDGDEISDHFAAVFRRQGSPVLWSANVMSVPEPYTARPLMLAVVSLITLCRRRNSRPRPTPEIVS